MRVLVVDDNYEIRTRLCSLVSEIDGVEVGGQAACGREAIALVRASAPDVMILDLVMPGTGGLDVLRELRQLASPPLVVVLTNHLGSAYRRRSEEMGAALFLDKSKDIDRLPGILQGLRDTTHARRAT